MKGKILGFNADQGAGAISGEDGSRHSFALADWRGERPPVAGVAVDFESRDGKAQDIYPLVSGAMAAFGSANIDLGGLSSSPQGEKLVGMFTRSLAAPLALVVLAACFMNAITSPMMSVSLLDLGKVLDGLNLAGAASSMAGGENSGLGTASTLLVLRFAAPIAAVWLIWIAATGKSERLPMLITGACAIGAALLVVGFKAAALSMLPDYVRDEASSVIGIGMGVWLLFLAGGALIAAALGKLRNPLAKG
jgi:hypothetical protein